DLLLPFEKTSLFILQPIPHQSTYSSGYRWHGDYRESHWQRLARPLQRNTRDAHHASAQCAKISKQCFTPTLATARPVPIYRQINKKPSDEANHRRIRREKSEKPHNKTQISRVHPLPNPSDPHTRERGPYHRHLEYRPP